jgi:UDP-N-acetylmuramate--alanine ligase
MKTDRSGIFFSGIGGSGVSALAAFMADRGHRVSGSDRAFEKNPYHPALAALKTKGVTIFPQDGSGINESLDLVVFSTAVEHDTPEYAKALALGLQIRTRPEFLLQIVSEHKTIAVAGTSGKSTTSGMLAWLMSRLGMKPNFIGGGRVKQFHSGSNPGNSITGNSDLLVMEACESDGSIVGYMPLHSIILNLELDHHPISETASMFEKLVANTAGLVVINADDKNLAAMPALKSGKTITFSVSEESQFRPQDVVFLPLRTEFSLEGVGFKLSMPGRHNLYNALACIAVLSGMGVELKAISKALPDFSGIERRFDIHLEDVDHLVIDDYAHNPHKISAMMQAASRLREKICYIFQPHGFGPTRMMKDEYIAAFSQGLRPSDHLILLPIFYAGGTTKQDISSRDLAAGIRKNGKSAEAVDDRNKVIKNLDKWDNYIIMGARDETLSAFAESIALLLGLK